MHLASGPSNSDQFFFVLVSRKKQMTMTEEQSCDDDIPNKTTAESYEVVTDEYKEIMLDQNKATAVKGESPWTHLTSPMTRAPTVSKEAGKGNFSDDATDEKHLTVESCVPVEEHLIETTGNIGYENGDVEAGIRASETVEEHIAAEGNNLFDTSCPRRKELGKRKHLLV